MESYLHVLLIRKKLKVILKMHNIRLLCGPNLCKFLSLSCKAASLSSISYQHNYTYTQYKSQTHKLVHDVVFHPQALHQQAGSMEIVDISLPLHYYHLQKVLVDIEPQ